MRPVDSASAAGARAGLTWLGHATTLIELDGLRLLTDPVLRNRVGPLVRYGAPVPTAPDAVDCVLISHLHADHTDLPSLRRVAGSAPIVAPRGAAEWLQGKGFDDVRELGRDETIRIGAVEVTGMEAVHEPGRRPFGPRAAPLGFLLDGSRSAYFAGDTDLFPEMAALSGRVDLALLPVWGWGPSVGAGHLDPERATRAAQLISPAIAVPIHWGTFALGPPLRRPRDPHRPARDFARLMAQNAPHVQTRIPKPGERIPF